MCCVHALRRLVEVNGVSVVDSTLEELTDILLQGPSAQIIALRQAPPTHSFKRHPPLLQHIVNPDPMQTIFPERDAVAMETSPLKKVIAI